MLAFGTAHAAVRGACGVCVWGGESMRVWDGELKYTVYGTAHAMARTCGVGACMHVCVHVREVEGVCVCMCGGWKVEVCVCGGGGGEGGRCLCVCVCGGGGVYPLEVECVCVRPCTV